MSAAFRSGHLGDLVDGLAHGLLDLRANLPVLLPVLRSLALARFRPELIPLPK